MKRGTVTEKTVAVPFWKGDSQWRIPQYWNCIGEGRTGHRQRHKRATENTAIVLLVIFLHDREDTEECLNDTWMRAWNAIPPKKPNRLELFLGTITRNLSFDRWKAKNAQKRGNGIMDTTLDELAECIPAAHNTEEAVEAAELERSINAFLHTLSEQECNVFLRRYWFVEEYAEIAGRYGMNLNTVKTSLFRTRKKLQKYLEQQGIVL